MTLRIAIEILCAALMASSANATWAQAMSDPTKPAIGLSAALGPVRIGQPGNAGLVLQSIRISQDLRSAIISGEHVLLGQKIAGLRLVKVSETQVVLLEGSERRTLKLFPGVEKRPSAVAHDGTPWPRP